MTERRSGIFRRTLWLGGISIALGALCGGVKGGGVAFGAIVGAGLFGTIGGM